MNMFVFSETFKLSYKTWTVFIVMIMHFYTETTAGPIKVITSIYGSPHDCLPCEIYCSRSSQVNSSLPKSPCLQCQCEPSVDHVRTDLSTVLKQRKQLIPIFLHLHCYFMMCPPQCTKVGEDKHRFGCKYCACGPLHQYHGSLTKIHDQ